MHLLTLVGVVVLAATAACGRSPTQDRWRIVSVAADQPTAAPGTAGLPVFVTIAGQDTSAEVLDCQLVYHGAGGGFSARLLTTLGTLEPGDTQALRFSVRLPANGTGSASLDATARLLVDGREVKVSGAEVPYAFAYSDQAGPDTSGLPTIAVTRYDDQFSGPPTMTSVADAGGLDDISLREAITIADNVNTPYLITFDPAFFDQSVAQPIVIGGTLPAITAAGVVIDGRGASVRINGPSAPQANALQIAAPRVALFGLLLDAGIGAMSSDDLWIADSEVDLLNGTYVGIYASSRVRIERTQLNAAYYIPVLRCSSCNDLTVSQLVADGSVAVDESTGVALTDSQIANVSLASSQAYVARTIIDEASGGSPTITVGENSAGTVFDTLDVAGAWTCFTIDTSQDVVITHSRLRCQSSSPIALSAGANGLLAPPTVTASADGVSGTTSAPDGSTVEVYQGDSFDLGDWLGDAPVTAGAFALSTSLTSGTSVTATVTAPGVGTSPVAVPSVVP